MHNRISKTKRTKDTGGRIRVRIKRGRALYITKNGMHQIKRFESEAERRQPTSTTKKRIE
jgi:hypothetical protein